MTLAVRNILLCLAASAALQAEPQAQPETTVEDETLAESLGQLMEGALTQYQRLVPEVALTTQPMRCHIFASTGRPPSSAETTQGGSRNVSIRYMAAPKL